MMPRYDNILTTKAMKDLVILQVGKALYNIQTDRPIFQSMRDLPAVGTKYVLVEVGTNTANGISPYGQEVYYNEIDDNFLEDTVISQQLVLTITAAYDDPDIYLQKFINKRHSTDFWWKYFDNLNIGINSIEGVTDASIPTESGEWEERFSITLEVNYLSKETVVINTTETIDFNYTITSEPTND